MKQWIKPKGKKAFRQMFEKNMHVLSARWPHIAELVKKSKPILKCEPLFDSIMKRPNLMVTTPNGKKIFLHSPDPVAESLNLLKQREYRYPQFLVFLGLGLGFYPLFFLKDKSRFIKQILIVERYPEILRWAMQLVDLTPLLMDSRVELMIGVPPEKTFPFLRKFMEYGIRKYLSKVIKFVIHDPSFALDKSYYMHVVSSFKDAVRETLLFFGNDPQDSLIGLDNIIKNLDNIITNPGIKDLYGKFHNKPAICVASGPSLEKNAHLLRDVQDKALIICCDATLKPLLYRFGVKPHIVTSLERVPQVVPFFEGLNPEMVKDTWLAACPVVVPEVYKVYPGPKIIVYRDFAHFRWLGIDKGILRIGPSCANMSFKIAEALGCNPIILVGQDLAYAETGESHVEGHIYGQEKARNNPNTFYVKGNYSPKVLTNPTWYMFLKHFELDISEYGGICVNATEGGAYIEGTKVMKLKDAIHKFIGEDIKPAEVIKENIENPDIVKVIGDLETFENRVLRDTCDFVSEVIERYKSMLERTQEFNRTILKNILKRNEDKLTKEEIEEAKNLYKDISFLKTDTMTHRLFYLYLMHVVQPYVINSEVELASCFDKYEDINFAYVEWVAKHEEWFKVMLGLIDQCKKRLDIAENVVKKVKYQLRPSY